MLRAPTLLAAFILVITLAGACAPMAEDSSASNATQDQSYASQDQSKTWTHNASCSEAPMYLNPAYCHPNGG